MTAAHAMRILAAIVSRDVQRFLNQTGRLLSALVRPALWLVVFAAGFQNVLGVSITPPYDTYVTYQEYVLPGLLAMTLLFQGVQSSLSMVYDREMGMMRLLLTAPAPRSYVLFCKLVAGAVLGVAQAYAFLVVASAFGLAPELMGWIFVGPALLAAALMLGALGLLLATAVRQLENFAGAMNFVIFPAFFLSTALYPLWKLKESGAELVWRLAELNPFTYAVELIRFALHVRLEPVSAAVVGLGAALLFACAAVLFDPQRSFAVRNRGAREAVAR